MMQFYSGPLLHFLSGVDRAGQLLDPLPFLTHSRIVNLSDESAGISLDDGSAFLESSNQSERPVRVFWLHLANLFLAVTTPSQFGLLGLCK